MNRRINKATFSFAEHCLYAGAVLAMLDGVMLVSYFAIARPSMGTLVMEILALGCAWWVMSQTRRASLEQTNADRIVQ
jgi:cbb3-type cytochrome oxidase subunit 3